jgi:glycine/D-amino acid oxidase-like deaminating enzyme
MGESYDVIVVGGGSIGLAVAYHATREGKTALLLERFEFFNDRGASSGAERQFRIQYNEKEISQLVLDSIPLWRELQTHSRDELLNRAGCLWFGNPKITGAEGQIEAVTRVMRELDVPYEELELGDIEGRFPFKDLPRAYSGFFQKDGASINVGATMKTLHDVAVATGRVTMKAHQELVGIESSADGVLVATRDARYRGKKLVLAPGPYINDVTRLLGFELNLVIWEMVGAYFRHTEPSLKYPTWITFDEKAGEDPMLYYGFPAVAWCRPGYVRVAANYPVRTHRDPKEYTRTPDAETVARIGRWVGRYMRGLDPEPVFPSTCICALATVPGNDLVLRRELIVDFAPEPVPYRRNVVVCASGWVYKIVPLLGKICVDLAIRGESKHDLSKLALA